MNKPRGPRTLAEALARHDAEVAKIDRWERRMRIAVVLAFGFVFLAPAIGWACRTAWRWLWR